jgi:L-lysine 2,3-aminomutase
MAQTRYHKHRKGQHYAAVMLLSMYDLAALVTLVAHCSCYCRYCHYNYSVYLLMSQ